MQKSLASLFLVILLMTSPACRVAETSSPGGKTGSKKETVKPESDIETAKPFQVKTLWGQSITVGNEPWQEEKPVILHFWGTWCEPCVEEFPSLMKFAEEYPEFSVCAISMGDERKTLLAFLKQMKYPITKAHALTMFMAELDNNVLLKPPYAINEFPTTLFIDRKGRILAGLSGNMDWQNSPYVKDAIEKISVK